MFTSAHKWSVCSALTTGIFELSRLYCWWVLSSAVMSFLISFCFAMFNLILFFLPCVLGLNCNCALTDCLIDCLTAFQSILIVLHILPHWNQRPPPLHAPSSFIDLGFLPLLFSFSNSPAHKYYLATSPVNGAVYLSDTSSRKVFKVKSLTVVKDVAKNLELVAGTGDQCLPYDDTRCGDGGKAVEATLTNPRGNAAMLS